MVKYFIENNIDFYGELNDFKNKIKKQKIEQKQKEDKEEHKEAVYSLNNDNICLISGTILEKHFVILDCNHKFNYIPLYKEICIQKYDFKTYNISQLDMKNKILIYENNKDYFIKCPYCRNIQFNILPYVEELNLEKKYGINTLDISYKNYDDLTSNNYIINNNSNINNNMFYLNNNYYKKGQCNISEDIKKIKPCSNYLCHIKNILLVTEL